MRLPVRPLTLVYHMIASIIVHPMILRRLGIELQHKRQNSISTVDVRQAIEHRCSRDRIIYTDPVNGQDSCLAVPVCERLDCMSHTLSARLRRQSVLERRCGCLHCSGHRLCDGPCDQPSHDVPAYNPPDSTCRLLQCSQSPHPKQCNHIRRNFCPGKILCSPTQRGCVSFRL